MTDDDVPESVDPAVLEPEPATGRSAPGSFCTHCGAPLSAEWRHCGSCGTAVAVGGSVATLQRGSSVSRYVAPSLGLTAAVLLAVGSLLPWVHAATVFGSISVDGVDGHGDGLLTLGLSAALLVPYLAWLFGQGGRWPARAALLLTGGATATALYDFVRIERLADSSDSGEAAGVGIGLYVCVVAAGLGIAVALTHLLISRPLRPRRVQALAGRSIAVVFAAAAIGGGIAGGVASGSTSDDSASVTVTSGPDRPGAVVSLDDVDINLADGHFLKLGLTLQLVKGRDASPPDGAAASDIANSYFTGRTVGDVTSPAGKAAAMKQILAEIKATPEYKGIVMAVYFPDYVTQ